jgi:hypothetical protein
MTDYEFGRACLRASELMRALQDPMPQSYIEANIVKDRTEELGGLVRQLMVETMHTVK